MKALPKTTTRARNDLARSQSLNNSHITIDRLLDGWYGIHWSANILREKLQLRIPHSLARLKHAVEAFVIRFLSQKGGEDYT